jgi:hypothetical protein
MPNVIVSRSADHLLGSLLNGFLVQVRAGLCHPVHQQFLIAAWEVLAPTVST